MGRSRSALAFAAEEGHSYLAVSPEAFLRPQIRPVEISSLRDTTNQADWILIAPRDFLPAAQELVDHRQAQGLSARAVALEDVYDSFGFGEVSPEAIHYFLAFAYHHWTPPAPRYVLLLGEASSDPKGFLTGPPRKDLLPTPLVKSSFLWAPSDLLYASLNGEDLLPDIAIGRLNANSIAEAQAALQKILDFENTAQTLDGPPSSSPTTPTSPATSRPTSTTSLRSSPRGPPRRSSSPSSAPPPSPPSSTPSTTGPLSSPTSATATRGTGPPRESSPPPTSPRSSPRPDPPSSSP